MSKGILYFCIKFAKNGNNNKVVQYNKNKGDDCMKQDEKDVKETKHRRSNKRYDIEIIEDDGTKRIFRTLLEANNFYKLRKDYLNYCFAEKNKSYLHKNGLKIKSIRRMTEIDEKGSVPLLH